MILLIFLAFAGLMMTRKMAALLALPTMSFLIALVAGLFYDFEALTADAPGPKTLQDFLFTTVLTEGPGRLAGAMMFAIFGAILSQVVMRAGIAQRLISVGAEYAGESKFLLAFMMTLMVAFCFTSVTGLGAVIMVGSLALPIMIGAGLSADFSACLMLFAIAIGGVFNPAILGVYQDTLGVPLEVVKTYVKIYGGILALTAAIFLVVGAQSEKDSFSWAAQVEEIEARPHVPTIALLTPILPILLIMSPLPVPIIPAFLIGILYGALTTTPKTAINAITAATLEGLKDISPVIGLFMGIGMALNAMMADPTKAVMAPFLKAIIPTSPVGFVVFFTLLAPLALYRGPFNFFGLGAGIAGLILGVGLLPPVAVMAAFFAVGQVQGVCDPTNTHNVWLAQFSKSSTEVFLKKTLPYVWAFVAAALCYAAFVGHALG
ncbi:MAG: transporter [Vulcanimicrobiota bacterium]